MTEFYKKYRPDKLSRVVGNEIEIATLAGMLGKGKLPHAILLTGPSGCGKTTIARIIRSELGCGDLDYQEMNSSAIRGIDSIRDIQRLMHLHPATGKARVWLFDEVHKWTPDAMTASLKMLEDTPPHVYFILATTDSQKLITPIMTRCKEFRLRTLIESEMESLLSRVARKEGIELTNAEQSKIFELSQGSARSALVLLDALSNLESGDRIASLELRAAEQNAAIDLCRALVKKTPWKGVAAILANLKGEPEEIRYAVLGYARAVLLKENSYQAYLIISCFKGNFYDGKHAALAHACYEVCNAEK